MGEAEAEPRLIPRRRQLGVIGLVFASGCGAAALVGVTYGADLGRLVVFGALAVLEGLNAFAERRGWPDASASPSGCSTAAFVAAAVLPAPAARHDRRHGRRPRRRAGPSVAAPSTASSGPAAWCSCRPRSRSPASRCSASAVDPTSVHAAGAALLAVVLIDGGMGARRRRPVPLRQWERRSSRAFVGALRFALVRAPFAASLGYVAGLAGQASAGRPSSRCRRWVRWSTCSPSTSGPSAIVSRPRRCSAPPRRPTPRSNPTRCRRRPRRGGGIALQADRAELVAPPAGRWRARRSGRGAAASAGSSSWRRRLGRGPADPAGGRRRRRRRRSRTPASPSSSATRRCTTPSPACPNQVLFADRVAQAVATPGRDRLRRRRHRPRRVPQGQRQPRPRRRRRAARRARRAGCTGAVRSGDTVARLSADVFMLLLARRRHAGARRRDHREAARRHPPPAPRRRPGDLHDRLRRRRLLPRRRAWRRATSCATPTAPCTGPRRTGPGSYEIYAQGMNEARPPAPGPGERAAPGRAPRRAPRALPAPDRPPHRADHRRRGARPLGAPDPRHAAPGRVRAPRRGVGPHRRGRHVGAPQGLRAGGRVAGAGAAAGPGGGQPVGPPLPVARAA